MRAALDGLESGTVLGVEGEPGIGKSRLLAELAAAAEERRFPVLEGRASEGRARVPFAPFLDALDDYLALGQPARDSSRPTPRPRRARADLPLARGARRATPRRRVQEERYRSHHAVRAMLEGLAAHRPLLLTIDDATGPTRPRSSWLSHLIRHRPRAPVLSRSAIAAPRRRSGWSPSSPTAERLRLQPLDEGSARELDRRARRRGDRRDSFASPAATLSTSSSWHAAGSRPRRPRQPAPTRSPTSRPASARRSTASSLGSASTAALLLRGAAVAARASIPSSRHAPPTSTTPPRSRRSTNCSPAISCAPTRSRGGFASATRSCARPYTRRPPPDGGSAPTLASPRC